MQEGPFVRVVDVELVDFEVDPVVELIVDVDELVRLEVMVVDKVVVELELAEPVAVLELVVTDEDVELVPNSAIVENE